jgi:hypothetical protein
LDQEDVLEGPHPMLPAHVIQQDDSFVIETSNDIHGIAIVQSASPTLTPCRLDDDISNRRQETERFSLSIHSATIAVLSPDGALACPRLMSPEAH